MKVRFWGTRGSLATPGPETARYGGNTSCVEVRGPEDSVLILDAGTGIRPLGNALIGKVSRVDLLLTHLHMDHLQGLGFFAPLYDRRVEVHIWGPASTTMSLETRLARYLSPPLFPIRLRELPCRLVLHEVPSAEAEIGPFQVSSSFVCHPGPTVGYRIKAEASVLTYLPDHEPALGQSGERWDPTWVSGFRLAEGADLLIHDAQYSDAEYAPRVGWGHSSLSQALCFAGVAGVRALVPFHYDPAHDDEHLDRVFAEASPQVDPALSVTPAKEGATIAVGPE